jgi:hypothetical protein
MLEKVEQIFKNTQIGVIDLSYCDNARNGTAGLDNINLVG